MDISTFDVNMSRLSFHWVWHRLKHYVRYRLLARGLHGTHSPFAYRFVQEVLRAKPTVDIEQIEQERKFLLNERDTIIVHDYGAGYGGDGLSERVLTLTKVVGSSARDARTGAILSKLARFQNPRNVLELGTNLGFSASYLLAGMSINASLQTVEGSQALAAIAQKRLGNRATVHCTTFDAFLDGYTGDFFDLVLLDGHHAYEPTIRYLSKLLPLINPEGVIVMDDIYWSPEMTKAWKWAQQLPEVSVSIDLYYLGILFFNRPQAKEHFILK
jgi:predicted O-methyltransferase YrrM